MYSNKNGGRSKLLPELKCSQIKISDIIDFILIPPCKNRDVLKQKYVNEGLSISQIADEFMFSKDAIRRALINFGIPIRKKSQHHGNPAQPRYGQKRRQKKVIEHKTELRTIKAIIKMKEEGLSLRAIARCLAEMKIPTKCRGKSWHPQMIKRIIDKNS